ncbi:Hypothetical protein Cul210931_1955 [Corynebacterium ulcerans]|nr:Hypothetical protein Cul210931_1955 [Corynebacterium ulcerans]
MSRLKVNTCRLRTKSMQKLERGIGSSRVGSVRLLITYLGILQGLTYMGVEFEKFYFVSRCPYLWGG